MANGKMRSPPGAGSIALGVFVIALILLMLFGYGLLGSLVLAGAVFSLFAYRRPSDAEGGIASAGRTAPAPTSASEPASGGKGGFASGPTAAPAPEPESTQPPPLGEPGTGGPAAGPVVTEGAEPPRLDAPREGGSDDLKKIKGIGPKLEGQLDNIGSITSTRSAAGARRRLHRWMATWSSFAAASAATAGSVRRATCPRRRILRIERRRGTNRVAG